MSRPFRAFADGGAPDPGRRCPGLVCHAPAGLIPTSLRKVSETLEEIASNPLFKTLFGRGQLSELAAGIPAGIRFFPLMLNP